MTSKLIRVTFIYVAVLSSFLMCGSRVAAQLTFVTNNGSITITGYTGPGGNVAIPAATNGYAVTAIGASAFSGLTNLTGVTIPNSVTNIGAAAFDSCAALANVTIGNGVTSIGDNGFYGCSSLRSVIIPNSVISLGSDMFDASGLTNVTIGSSLTNISDGAFRYCALTSVTIPNSVTSIGYYAFYQCQYLTSMTIGSGVTSISIGAFQYAYQLTNIIINPANPSYAAADGVLYNKAMTTLIRCSHVWFGGYVVPNGVTTINAGAFQDSPGMTSVTIPSSVTSIGDVAFGFGNGLGAAYFQGNAPVASELVFYFSAPGTVYYQPGTTGWGATFGGWSTAPWYQPRPQILGPSRQGNGFQFTVSWATNTSVIIETCTNLASPVWTPLATNSLVQGTNYFADPQWTNSPRRFYRATAAP